MNNKNSLSMAAGDCFCSTFHCFFAIKSTDPNVNIELKIVFMRKKCPACQIEIAQFSDHVIYDRPM